MDITETYVKTLRLEADGLRALAAAMPEDFPRAVALTLEKTGRVIVSGVGKSGHIARKIAATLASTGTPAYFVHATEASHGDLGMVTEEDILLLISNSGETTELRDIVAHSRRFSIPMIAISSKPDSTLMGEADLRLTLPKMPEACAIGMAPTTSTTMTLAMGDAFAVALMEARAFRPDQFQVFHPGGKLGAQMLRVGQIMHGGDALPRVGAETPMSETLLEMTSKGFGLAAVTRGEALVGVVTDGDLRRNMGAGLLDRTAEQVCTPDPVTVTEAMLAAEALALLNERKISALLVVDGARPVGVLHIHDLLRAGVA